MEYKSTDTARPVLAGFEPGATVTVKRVELRASTGFGLAVPVPEGEFDGSPSLSDDEVLHGVGAPAEKSAGLLFVSVPPPYTWLMTTFAVDDA